MTNSQIPLPNPELFGIRQPLTHRLYDRVQVEAVRVVVQNNLGQILTGVRKPSQTRPSQRGQKQLEFLGGKPDGDSYVCAAQREVSEEAGIEVFEVAYRGLIGIHTIPNTYREGKYAGALIVQHCVSAHHLAGAASVSDEHKSVEWKHPDEIWSSDAFRAGTHTALLLAGIPRTSKS
ncbi:MAG TPA: NUDIX hydrolase [Candidatus Saccharibacteria bacterium]|jgi:8-oxo-dGTP pyrophosphatase MutT (NUDIX family)|nr:NUDIX hydrolase [Candidatus Saccharibacteria bacterium]